MSQPKDNKISINMVVNGKLYELDFSAGQKIKGIVEKTLEETENIGQPIENWELRHEDGTLLDFDKHLRDFNYQDGVTLILNPKAGVGGFTWLRPV